MARTVFAGKMKILNSYLNKIFGPSGHRHTGLDEDGHAALDYAADTGAANAYVVDLTPVLPQLVAGMPISFLALNTNTGASTLNVNGLGIKDIRKNGTAALDAGDIVAGRIYTVEYDGANFQILNHSGVVQLVGAQTIAGAKTFASAISSSAAPSGTPDANSMYKDNIIKGWINFNGTGTIAIRDSFNVASIVDEGVGNYTINWDRDFANTDYAVVGSVRQSTGTSDNYLTIGTTGLLAGSANIHTFSIGPATEDCDIICVIAIGDQA